MLYNFQSAMDLKTHRIAVLLSLLMGGPWSCAREPTSSADLIVSGGSILTVDADFSVAQAMAVKDGRILAVGTDQEIQPLAGSHTRSIDLGGKMVVPGLADNHLHRAGGGPGVDLSRVRTMEELLAAIADRVGVAAAGELMVTNSDWHEAQLKEQRLPLRRDLDRVASRNPLVVVRGGHEYILNSRALEKWNITPHTPIPEGGRISRYPDGQLNGELVDTARYLVELPALPPRELESRIQDQLDEYQRLHAVGLTSVRHPGGTIEQYRLLEEMRRRGLLRMRVTYLLRMRHARTAADVEARLTEWNVEPQQGDEWLRLAGIKLGVDGGFEGGWMREPYAEPFGRGGTFHGLQTMPQQAYTQVVKELGRRGWRVSTHAVGDAAIDQVLEGYEAANREFPMVGARWTIEHGFIPRADHFPRIKQLGLMVSAQNHLYLAGPSLEKYWGRNRAHWVTPMRAYLDNGVMVSAGTDSPVVPFPPLWVIYHLVTRDTISGGIYGADQRITRPEALRMVTINNAHLSFEEEIKGSLEAGKLADFVVLSDDILAVAEKDIRDIQVMMTVVGGEVVYSP